jgi:hypothetical protein
MFVVSTAVPEEPQGKKYVDTIYKSKAPRVPHQEELENYLSIGPEDRDENVLIYYKKLANQWPNMSIMAREYLAAAATSASSIRGFSSGSDILGMTRHSMSPLTMEAYKQLPPILDPG